MKIQLVSEPSIQDKKYKCKLPKKCKIRTKFLSVLFQKIRQHIVVSTRLDPTAENRVVHGIDTYFCYTQDEWQTTSQPRKTLY
jgi:hypothetical protein